MSTNIEIYWQDLTPAKQQEILEAFGENCNFDSFPIATIPIDPDGSDNLDCGDGFDDYLSICEEVVELYAMGNPTEAISEILGMDENEIIQIIERECNSDEIQ